MCRLLFAPSSKAACTLKGRFLDIHSSITLAVVVLFFWQSLKYGAWQWFWASIVIWLAAAWFSAELLPRVMGVTHAANLYLAHAYILPASVFFWVNHVQKQPDAQEYRSTAGPMLTYFAQSLLAMHCALALTAATTYAIFPDGFSVYVAAALGAFYMQPALWWGMTLWLMAMAALAHWAWNAGEIVVRARQIIVLSVLAFALQAAFIVLDLKQRFQAFL